MTFYLFSSDYAPRYKTDVLDALCYPKNHIFRFRYQDIHVSEEIKRWASPQSIAEQLKKVGCTGVIVYAETTGTVPNKQFNFYLVREVEIIRIKPEGSIYYVDFRFGKFISYHHCGRDKAADQLREFQAKIEAITYHPLPPLEVDASERKRGKTWDISTKQKVDYNDSLKATTQGYFFRYVPENSASRIQYSTEESSQAWESVVDILSQSPSMRSCIFYLIRGFYKVRRRFGRIGTHQEILIKSVDDKWSTKYPLPMGQNVVLKLLFYRSQRAPKIPPQKLDVKFEGGAFAGISKKEVPVHSRYNEERVLIACKRVFDSTLAPISIEHKRDQSTPENMLAPNPFLLTQVRVPKHVVGIILTGLVVAPIFLSLSPDFLRDVGHWLGEQESRWVQVIGNLMSQHPTAISSVSKGMAALVTLVAGWFGFRRLPIGK